MPLRPGRLQDRRAGGGHPDAQALHQQQRQTRQALDGLAERAWMVEASRKRVGCLPLAPAEVEKRIQTVLQAPAMPESWERRRAR